MVDSLFGVRDAVCGQSRAHARHTSAALAGQKIARHSSGSKERTYHAPRGSKAPRNVVPLQRCVFRTSKPLGRKLDWDVADDAWRKRMQKGMVFKQDTEVNCLTRMAEPQVGPTPK